MLGNTQTIYVLVGALLVSCVAVIAYLAIIASVHSRLRLMKDFHEAIAHKIKTESGYADDQIDRSYLDKYIELQDTIETWLDREGMIRKTPRKNNSD